MLKLDLTNSKWWNTGLSDSNIQQALKSFLLNEETLALKKAEDSVLNMGVPLDVRDLSHGGEQSSLLQDLHMRTD